MPFIDHEIDELNPGWRQEVNVGQRGIIRQEGLYSANISSLDTLAIQKDIGAKDHIAETLTLLGQINFFQENHADAKRKIHQGLSIIRQITDHLARSNVLFYFCNTYAHLHPQSAMQILAILHGYYPINPLMRREADSAIAKARQHLDDSELEAAWSEDEKMTIEEAINLALHPLNKM